MSFKIVFIPVLKIVEIGQFIFLAKIIPTEQHVKYEMIIPNSKDPVVLLAIMNSKIIENALKTENIDHIEIPIQNAFSLTIRLPINASIMQ